MSRDTTRPVPAFTPAHTDTIARTTTAL